MDSATIGTLGTLFGPARAEAERAGHLVGEVLERHGLAGSELDRAAVLLAHEAALHADPGAELRCRVEGGALLLEVADSRLRAPLAPQLHYLALAADEVAEWGVAFDRAERRAWFRLPLPRAAPGRAASSGAAEWTERGRLALLAEAGELLAGLLDERQVATVAAQLVVPRIAEWSAVYLAAPETGETELAFAWHTDERRTAGLRAALAVGPPPSAPGVRSLPLESHGQRLGLLVAGREQPFPPEPAELLEDLGRRVALALGSARALRRQRETSLALQQGLLPRTLPDIPGIESALVYEPAEGGGAEVRAAAGGEVGGDFYDLFPLAGGTRWCFALGDVCGHGPHAAAVTGLARHALRVLARAGVDDPDTVVARLNQAVLDEAEGPDEPNRLLALLYGELTPRQDGGADCALVCAGQPLPLLLAPDGRVRPEAGSQLMLGVDPSPGYRTERIRLRPGDTLLCVTDGVTERRLGDVLLDDGDGLARLLSDCAGLGAAAVADRLRRAVRGFAPGAPTDDFAMLVLRARQ